MLSFLDDNMQLDKRKTMNIIVLAMGVSLVPVLCSDVENLSLSALLKPIGVLLLEMSVLVSDSKLCKMTCGVTTPEPSIHILIISSSLGVELETDRSGCNELEVLRCP